MNKERLEMQPVEEHARGLLKRRKIQDALVIALYAGSILATAIVAPNAASVFRYVEPYIGMRNTKARTSQAISRLVGCGMLKREGYGNSARLSLTPAGKRYADAIFNSPDNRITVPTRWDGRWRIVIFDIWEKRRSVRDRLRSTLQRIGFVKIQNSVWVFPYECEEVVALVRAELRVGKGIVYIVADAVEGDKDLRAHFKLSS
jgi:DNA-binding transcriptional regulator PaaX